MKFKKTRLFTVFFWAAILLLAVSFYQLALPAPGGYTFRCYGTNCPYCGCVGDSAITIDPCCGTCYGGEESQGFGMRCCGMYCPNY